MKNKEKVKNILDIKEKLSSQHGSFDAFLDANRTYGISIAIIKNNQLDETYAIGLKDPIDTKTCFQAASISKSIFAATLMLLDQQGYMDIHCDIREYLEQINQTDLIKNPYPLTLLDLLSHTGGLNIHGFSGYLKGQTLPTLHEIILGIRPSNSLKVQMIEKPKSKFIYSGGGYMLAQYILEKVTQKSYIKWAEELIFKPLHMKHSTFDVLDHHVLYAKGWSAYDQMIEGDYLIYPEVAAAGLWSTPSDLALLGIEIMKSLGGKSTWMKEEYAKVMTTLPQDIETSYGCGFHVKKQAKGFLFGHGGANTGYHSHMEFCYETKEGIITMINSEIGEEIPRIVNQMFFHED
jgi:CubicO group peptidase (beta-lactamase class C family)